MDDSTKILFGIVIGAILISLSIYLVHNYYITKKKS